MSNRSFCQKDEFQNSEENGEVSISFLGVETVDFHLSSRRSNALFQHHDGTSGTAKAAVMRDYADKLHGSLWAMNELMQIQVIKLLENNVAVSETVQCEMLIDYQQPDPYDLPIKRMVNVSNHLIPVVIYNSLTVKRKDHIMKILVSNPNIEVLDSQHLPIEYEMHPIVNGHNLDIEGYYAYFKYDLQPLSLTTFFLKGTTVISPNLAKIQIVSDHPTDKLDQFMEVHSISKSSFDQNPEISLFNDYFTITLSSRNGLIKELAIGTAATHTIQLGESLLEYSAVGGAYLFLPKSITELSASKKAKTVVATIGRLVSTSTSFFPDSVPSRSVTVYNTGLLN